MRAVRRGGWRDPALFALVLLAIGSVNASALAPRRARPRAVAVPRAAPRSGRGRAPPCRRRRASRCWASACRSGGPWACASQGAYGLPVLQLTENLRTVSRRLRPDDCCAGWATGSSTAATGSGTRSTRRRDYARRPLVDLRQLRGAGARARRRRRRAVAAPRLLRRPRHRRAPSSASARGPTTTRAPTARVWKRFANDSVRRSRPAQHAPRRARGRARARRAPRRRGERPAVAPSRLARAGSRSSLLAAAALWPVWQDGYLSRGVDRPRTSRRTGREAAAALDGAATTPACSRSPAPTSPPTAGATPSSPSRPGSSTARTSPARCSRTARRSRSTCSTRSTAGSSRAPSSPPRSRPWPASSAWAPSPCAPTSSTSAPASRAPDSSGRCSRDPLPPGLEPPEGVRCRRLPNRPPPPARRRRARAAHAGDAADPPRWPSSTWTTRSRSSHAAPAASRSCSSGDGDGIVDAAAAGLLDGNALVLELAAMDDDSCRAALDAGADLVLTDSNRRRIQNWFSSVRDTTGPPSGRARPPPIPNGYDFRLDVFPGSTDDERTVVEQGGGRAFGQRRVRSRRSRGPRFRR